MTKRTAMSTSGHMPGTTKKPCPSERGLDSAADEHTKGDGGSHTLSRMPTDTSICSSATTSSSQHGGRRQTTCHTKEEECAELEREGIVVVDKSGAVRSVLSQPLL